MVETVNNNPSHFLSSVESPSSHISYRSETIDNVLRSNRWFVILNDSRNAKTMLLRWITRVSAETAHRSFEEIDLEEDGRSTVRISILILIGKFAAWLDQ